MGPTSLSSHWYWALGGRLRRARGAPVRLGVVPRGFGAGPGDPFGSARAAETLQRQRGAPGWGIGEGIGEGIGVDDSWDDRWLTDGAIFQRDRWSWI